MSRPRLPSLVSVIIPTLNSAPWVAEAIASVRRQDHEPVEVIVVDNGSSDATCEIALQQPGVTLLREERRGPAAARNRGLDEARGEFVQFLDADDLLAPGKIARQVAAMRTLGADVVWGSFVRFTDGAEAPFASGAVTRPRIDADDVAGSLVRPDGFVQLGSALFRAGPHLDAVRFDEAVRVVEDVRFLIALATRGALFREAPGGEAALAMREHDSPARASRVGAVEFWDSCVANADLVLESWRARGLELTPARVATLAVVWLDAAETFHRHGDEARLDAVLARLAAVDADFLSRLRRPHRVIAPLLGYRATFSLAGFVRRVRDRLRGHAGV